jgi:hypothetical protein
VSQVFQGRKLGKALLDEGLIPANARLLELVVPADGPVTLRLELFVSNGELEKLIRAMQAMMTAPPS